MPADDEALDPFYEALSGIRWLYRSLDDPQLEDAADFIIQDVYPALLQATVGLIEVEQERRINARVGKWYRTVTTSGPTNYDPQPEPGFTP